MKQPTTPRQKPPPQPGRYILCIGKWAAMEMLSIQHGFPLIEQPESQPKPKRKPATK